MRKQKLTLRTLLLYTTTVFQTDTTSSFFYPHLSIRNSWRVIIDYCVFYYTSASAVWSTNVGLRLRVEMGKRIVFENERKSIRYEKSYKRFCMLSGAFCLPLYTEIRYIKQLVITNTILRLKWLFTTRINQLIYNEPLVGPEMFVTIVWTSKADVS